MLNSWQSLTEVKYTNIQQPYQNSRFVIQVYSTKFRNRLVHCVCYGRVVPIILTFFLFIKICFLSKISTRGTRSAKYTVIDSIKPHLYPCIIFDLDYKSLKNNIMIRVEIINFVLVYFASQLKIYLTNDFNIKSRYLR